jgi:hypothetical protein
MSVPPVQLPVAVPGEKRDREDDYNPGEAAAAARSPRITVCFCDRSGGMDLDKCVEWKQSPSGLGWHCKTCLMILPTAADKSVLQQAVIGTRKTGKTGTASKMQKSLAGGGESSPGANDWSGGGMLSAWTALDGHVEKQPGHGAAWSILWQCSDEGCVKAQNWPKLMAPDNSPSPDAQALLGLAQPPGTPSALLSMPSPSSATPAGPPVHRALHFTLSKDEKDKQTLWSGKVVKNLFRRYCDNKNICVARWGTSCRCDMAKAAKAAKKLREANKQLLLGFGQPPPLADVSADATFSPVLGLSDSSTGPPTPSNALHANGNNSNHGNESAGIGGRDAVNQFVVECAGDDHEFAADIYNFIGLNDPVANLLGFSMSPLVSPGSVQSQERSKSIDNGSAIEASPIFRSVADVAGGGGGGMPLAVATPLGSVGGVATPAPAYRSISGASSSNGTNGLSERALDKIQDALEKINEVLSTPNPTKALLSSLKEIVKPVLQQCRSNQEMRKALKHLCAGGSSDDLLGGQAMSRSNSLTG